MTNYDGELKADPLGGMLPQELVTGDIMRGRGPRRGNLERLLRYWRPIMRKEGGFRRCRLILANHPELFPLNNICAWLHHETTGLWPNEGCHHPGMKNCRKKLKKLGWNDRQFSTHINTGKEPANIIREAGKSAQPSDDTFFHDFSPYDTAKNYVVTEDDMMHAMTVLSDFMEMEPEFAKLLRDNNNWEVHGDDDNGSQVVVSITIQKSLEEECCG
jgi:hypothetical protein